MHYRASFRNENFSDTASYSAKIIPPKAHHSAVRIAF